MFADEDRLTQAVTLFALLEMHKRGEATWEQRELFGPIEVEVMTTDLERIVEALLFLSPEPVSTAELAEACDASEAEIDRALDALEGALAEGTRGVVLRQVAGGYTLAADPVAEDAARRLLSNPRTPPLTQAQAETLAIVSYLQPVSRPEIARIRGVSSESAVRDAHRARPDRGVRALALRRGRLPDDRRCSRSSSASPASSSCRTHRGSTPRPTTSASFASGC